MRPHRRPGPLQHVLIGACADDLPTVQQLLDALPEEAYGQVWVEGNRAASTLSGAPVAAPVLRHPGRVSVYLLATSVGSAPGEQAAAALRAGQAEWLPELECAGRAVTVWAGESVRRHLAQVGVEFG